MMYQTAACKARYAWTRTETILLAWRLRRHCLLCSTTTTLVLPFMPGPAPGPLPTTWSNHAARSPMTLAPLTCALPNNFRDVAYLPVHLKHTYPMKRQTWYKCQDFSIITVASWKQYVKLSAHLSRGTDWGKRVEDCVTYTRRLKWSTTGKGTMVETAPYPESLAAHSMLSGHETIRGTTPG
jgi:hypothetical protein